MSMKSMMRLVQKRLANTVNRSCRRKRDICLCAMGKIEVLYICHTPSLGGAAMSLFTLICSLRNEVVPTVLLPGKGSTYDLFVKNGIRCIIFPFRLNIMENSLFMHRLCFIPKALYARLKVKRCVRYVMHEMEGRDVRIVHSNSSIMTIGHDLAKALSARHVWHIREFMDLDFGLQPYYGWKSLKRKIYSSDAVVAISKAIYRHWGLDAAPYACCIWNAVRSKGDVVMRHDKEKFFFFCAAVLCDSKGVKFAIEAFAHSGLARDGYRLVVAGNSTVEYRSELDSLIAGLGLLDRVEFIGFCKDVKAYMSGATAFLMCSENEGLGRVTVEAMFYGCPVIARNTGGTLDFIEDKVTGLLFSDFGSCVEAMKIVAGGDTTDMVGRAQRFAVGHFSEENYGSALMDVYKRVLGMEH